MRTGIGSYRAGYRGLTEDTLIRTSLRKGETTQKGETRDEELQGMVRELRGMRMSRTTTKKKSNLL